MPVTRYAVLHQATAAQLWELYEEGFGPLAARSVARQVLNHGEFVDRMRDARVWKYVQRDDDGAVIGLATLTRHLETVHTISPEYFAARWPREYAEGRVYYVGFVLIAAQRRHQGHYAELVRAVVGAAAAARALVGFDISTRNDELLDVLQATGRRAGPDAVPDLVTLDAQTFYAVTFRAPDGQGPTRDGTVIDLTETTAAVTPAPA